jgi:hypothetical protein
MIPAMDKKNVKNRQEMAECGGGGFPGYFPV